MGFPSDSLSGLTARDKIVTAEEAVALIRDGDTIVAEGFAGAMLCRRADPGVGGAVSADRLPPRSDVGVHRGTR